MTHCADSVDDGTLGAGVLTWKKEWGSDGRSLSIRWCESKCSLYSPPKSLCVRLHGLLSKC